MLKLRFNPLPGVLFFCVRGLLTHLCTLYIPDNHQKPRYTSAKTGPWYVIIATNTDTQEQDADEKQFAENAEKTKTHVTKQINTRTYLSVKAVEKDT